MPSIKIIIAAVMLVCSNTFMTIAWYGLLAPMRNKPWIIAVLASWSVAFFEYLIMVAANRIGSTVLSLSQLKIMQESISLLVFVPFAVFIAKQQLSWNYLWAGLCIVGAVFFIFKA